MIRSGEHDLWAAFVTTGPLRAWVAERAQASRRLGQAAQMLVDEFAKIAESATRAAAAWGRALEQARQR